jgi:hypothetical protein
MMLPAKEYRDIVWIRFIRAFELRNSPATGVSACSRMPLIRSRVGTYPSGRPVTCTHCMPK